MTLCRLRGAILSHRQPPQSPQNLNPGGSLSILTRSFDDAFAFCVNDQLRRVWIADCSDMPLNLRGRVLKRAPAVMHVGIFKHCSRIWIKEKWTWAEKPEPHIEIDHFYSNTMSPIALPSRVQAPVAARPFAKAVTCILVLSR